MLLSLILWGGVMSSCSDDKTGDGDGPTPEPTFTVALGTVGPNSAELTLTTNKIVEYAWLCYPAAGASAPSTAVLFATGTTGTCADGNTSVTVSDLDPQTEYVVYFAGKTSATAFYDVEITPAKFTTTDFTDEITVIKRTIDGFAVHINVPKEVTAPTTEGGRGNVVKWSIGTLPMYIQQRNQGIPEATQLMSNDDYYNKFLTGPATLTFDEAHRTQLDEDGNPKVDEYGDPITDWDFVAPGEPLVLLLGEHAWGESDWGWGEGWYKALFDYDAYYESIGGGGGGILMAPSTRGVNDPSDEDAFWTGYHKRLMVRAAEPEVLNAKVNIETADLTPIGGTLRFTPEEGVLNYCVGIFDNALYTGDLLPMLDNDESLLQWYVTSIFGLYQGAQTLEGNVEVSLSDFFYEVTPGVPYHVILTAMGNAEGTTQSFSRLTFELPEPTLPAPQIEVKGISNPEGEDSPYEVWFNIKAPTKDVVTAAFACNYVREFDSALANGSTYTDLIESNKSQGLVLDAASVEKINSDEGLDLWFTSREDAVSRLAVMGWNVEGTGNNPDEENSTAVAEMRTIAEPDATRVESPLFTELIGDWTATATVKFYQYNTTTFQNEWVDIADPIKTKVTIGEVTYPQTLPSDVYGLYENMSKEQVDALYAEFRQLADIYNQKVRGQNRLQCLGLNFDVEASDAYAALRTASPYDLFTMTDYGSSTMDGLFYDFGPKWYLQVAADGTVSVPVNTDRIVPLTCWMTGQEYYLGGSNDEYSLIGPKENDQPWPQFPVAVSADKNTLTVKKVDYAAEGIASENFCPTVLYSYYDQIALYDTRIVSEIVLTRGWTEPASAPAKMRRGAVRAAAMSTMSSEYLPAAGNAVLRPHTRPMSRTLFSGGNTAAKKYKRLEGRHGVTSEQFKANTLKYTEQMTSKAGRK